MFTFHDVLHARAFLSSLYFKLPTNQAAHLTNEFDGIDQFIEKAADAFCVDDELTEGASHVTSSASTD